MGMSEHVGSRELGWGMLQAKSNLLSVWMLRLVNQIWGCPLKQKSLHPIERKDKIKLMNPINIMMNSIITILYNIFSYDLVLPCYNYQYEKFMIYLQ